MGKGKGKYKCLVGNILKNEIILEFTPLNFWFYGKFIHSALSKLPVRMCLVSKKTNEDSFGKLPMELPHKRLVSLPLFSKLI
jgi:ribosomal protein L16/L10AE